MLAIALLGAFVVVCVPYVHDRAPVWLIAGLIISVYLTTTLLVVLRALLQPTLRWAWASVGLGLCCYTCGTISSWIATWRGDDLPFPSVSDIGWLLTYPFVYVGILGFIRAGTTARQMLLDGAVAGSGGAALFSTIVVDVLSHSHHAEGLAATVTLAYPLADSLMVGTLLCQLTVGSWHRRRELVVFTAGMIALTYADTAYVLAKNYTPGSLTDLAYVTALTILGVSAWLRNYSKSERRSSDSLRIGLATTFASGALIVLLAATRTPISPQTVSLCGLTLLLVLVRFCISFRELRTIGEDRHREARRDPLTGLANRRGFAEYLDELRTAPPKTRIAGLLLDLNRFKEVNDSFGHEAGDALLRESAARLQAVLRGSDLLARLGGDEFVIVCASERLDDSALTSLAERIRTALRSPFDLAGLAIEIDVSIGIATCDGSELSPDSLLRHADIAMYTAKRGGGGHAFYQEHDDEAARAHLELVQELRRDVGSAALILHYQPKLDLGTNAVNAVEALVRWQHPTRGLLFPDEFLPIVEEIGLTPALTRNVLTQATDQIAAWRNQHLLMPVAVNISAEDLETPGFTDLVVELLRDRRLPADALTLEITETTAIGNSERAHRTLRELHHLGIKVSIDDYGTGHSTLAHLHRLLVARELKLDRCFLTNLETEERTSVIVQSSIQLAHALGMRVVAEGVEDAESLDKLRQWGCDIAQGYYIGRPQPASVLASWLLAAPASPRPPRSAPPATSALPR